MAMKRTLLRWNNMGRRIRFLLLAGFIAAGCAGSLTWVSLPSGPRLAIVSDLHLRPEVFPLAVERWREVLAEKPDAILVAGDIAESDQMIPLMERDYRLFRYLVNLSDVPVYAIQGNHDYDWHGLPRAKHEMDACVWERILGARQHLFTLKGARIAMLESCPEPPRNQWRGSFGITLPPTEEFDLVVYHRPMMCWNNGSRSQASARWPKALFICGDTHNYLQTRWGNILEISCPSFSGTWWDNDHPFKDDFVPAGYLVLQRSRLRDRTWRVDRKEFLGGLASGGHSFLPAAGLPEMAGLP